LVLSESGEPLKGATLEHVIPQSWFGKRAASRLLQGLMGPDDPRNLALACARCNQGKGKRIDARGPLDERAVEVILALFKKRSDRFTDPA
jgi:5-methylcytosine-specific restriction endonuclease McrA